ncbi:flagellin [Temperatibacter marinus]|uniref:Flagellin n=1 Tax=Temperatibacter marinus TaxID=1456591 RepID=A0AA52EF27_9PROT|nr:flagellin [Temperatibacter marinus]WND01908.1 flagellin [Temperatibacter marinus]
MTFSVNVNPSALAALRNLNKTSDDLEMTQTNINTGLKISSAKDNAAVFSIAQKLRGDVRGLNAVQQSLDRGISSVDVALAASNAISDLLLEMKEKAVAAADIGLDTTSRSALSQDFSALRNQISSIINNAEFNGTNLIDGGSDQIVAITNADATQTLSVAHENLSLGSSVITISSTQVITTSTLASSAVTALNTSIDNLNSVLTRLGSGSTALEQNRDFAGKLQDVIETGIGNLVDADMAKESARLQALQVKQQLGIQALSIANQSPQSILSLFQG